MFRINFNGYNHYADAVEINNGIISLTYKLPWSDYSGAAYKTLIYNTNETTVEIETVNYKERI